MLAVLLLFVVARAEYEYENMDGYKIETGPYYNYYKFSEGDTMTTATIYVDEPDDTDIGKRDVDPAMTTPMRRLNSQEISDVKDALKQFLQNQEIDEFFLSTIRTELAMTTSVPTSWVSIANNVLNEILKDLQRSPSRSTNLEASRTSSIVKTPMQSKPPDSLTAPTQALLFGRMPTRSNLVEKNPEWKFRSPNDDNKGATTTTTATTEKAAAAGAEPEPSPSPPPPPAGGSTSKRRRMKTSTSTSTGTNEPPYRWSKPGRKTRWRTRMRLSRTFTYSTTTSRTRMRKTRTRTTTTQPTPYIDIQKLIDLITNLTLDYSGNLTRKVNDTMQNVAMFTCPGWTTTTPTPTPTIVPTTTDPYGNLTGTIMGKCFVCGLTEEAMPRGAACADAFAGDFIPLAPVDATARGRIANFRKYCRWMNIPRYMIKETDTKSMWGRWTGGCSVRWIDISPIYTQRSCRNRHRAIMGKHWVSKRMAKLEMALQSIDNGCIISPAASLVPLSRGISLYARFHACVCTGSWCNQATFNTQWIAYTAFAALLTIIYIS